MRLASPPDLLRRGALALSLSLAGCAAGSVTTPTDGAADLSSPAVADLAPRPPDLTPDPSAPYFAPDHLVEVAITLAPADWDTLRGQSRSLADLLTNCLKGPFPDPYTYLKAQVTVDGITVAEVGVRKKGFLGSLDSVKPGLKIKFDQYLPGQRLGGLKGMTLNNSKQDPSYVHQCLAYSQFRAAGVPASRCNFAHVRVNGVDLGLYVHVESGSQDFLERAVSDPDGNLYEGTLSDFRDGWIATFDKKTNEGDTDRSDLAKVAAALQAPDDQLLAQLEPLVDLDEFLSFWATEVLVAHWDGYNGNTNNFFAYHDPASGKFLLLPWGTDYTFSRGPSPFAQGAPTSVVASSQLSRRLYLLPATRDRYLARMKQLLATRWDEAAMTAEIDRMEKLITPVADPQGKLGLAQALAGVRDFVKNRRGEIEAELKAGAPAWNLPLTSAPCFKPVGNVAGSFDTTWGTAGSPNPLVVGHGTISGAIDGVALKALQVGATAGIDPNAMPPAAQVVVAALLDSGGAGLVGINMDPSRFVKGATVPLDWLAATGVVYRYSFQTAQLELLGLLLGGSVHLEEASRAPGAAVKGTFQGDVIRSPF